MVKFRLKAFKTTYSTNNDCLEAAQECDPGGLWVVAERQQQGRGRQGRSWSSVAGNLFTSVLLVDPCEMKDAAQLSFIAALAVYATVKELTGVSYPRLALKWPNDVLLEGAKISGILLEAKTVEKTGNFALVIGIGINVLSHPEGMPYAVASLAHYNPHITVEQVRDTLMANFYKFLVIWNGGRFSVDGPPKKPVHFTRIRELWLERAKGIGEQVTIRFSEAEKTGLLQGIDAHGRLELLTEKGLSYINAGDLFFNTEHSR